MDGCAVAKRTKGLPYPNVCGVCHCIVSNIGGERCDIPLVTINTHMERKPPRTGYYPEANTYVRQHSGASGYRVDASVFTAKQAREAAHLLNQFAEYLECKQS